MATEAEAAYASYAREQWRPLVRAAIFLGAMPHEADDLAQTTLVRCYHGWDRVSGADNRDAYVYKMLLNCLRDARRTRWWRTRADPLSEGSVGDQRHHGDFSDTVATADAVHRALDALTKPNREVVVLRYFVQLTEAQTAATLGISPGTVKSRLSRSLARLAADRHLTSFRPDLSGELDEESR